MRTSITHTASTPMMGGIVKNFFHVPGVLRSTSAHASA